MAQVSKPKRIPELDVLRGFAAFGVMLYHYTTWYDHLYKHAPGVLVYFPKGKYGVELFFMISGFVILMTLERNKSDTDFLVGRFSRLFPAYWIAVILTFVTVSITKLSGLVVEPSEALVNLTMLQGFFNVRHVDNVYWTLELELSFYSMMFILYKLNLLKKIEKVSMGWLLILILIAFLRHYFWVHLDLRLETLFLLNSANLFVIGLMFYRIYANGPSVIRYAVIIASLLIYKLQYGGSDVSSFHSWSEFFMVVAFIVLFEFVLEGKLRFISLSVFLFLGSISYSLYLIHQNIGYSVIQFCYGYRLNPNLSIVIAMTVSLLLASAITFWVEKPSMRLIKNKYFAYKSKAAVSKI